MSAAIGFTHPPLHEQAKRGSQLNGKALDLGGWRQITTAQHSDNASGATARALDEFFHSTDASGEDNQNKQMVRVDLGLDPKTGEQLYALHPRREQKASLRRLLPVFRRSAIASRLREETRVKPVVKHGKTIRKGRTGKANPNPNPITLTLTRTRTPFRRLVEVWSATVLTVLRVLEARGTRRCSARFAS